MDIKKGLLCTLCLSSFFVGGCISSPSSSGDGSVQINEVNGAKVTVCSQAAVKDTVVVPLSELVESCSLVRCENKDEAFFKAWWINVTDNYIGIRQNGKVYKLFNHSGKFLGDIGALGQGPGEYAGTLYDDIIDDANGMVYLSPFYGNKIYQYGIDGNLIKEIPLNKRFTKPKISLNSNGTLSVAHMSKGQDEAMIVQIDKEGSVVKQLLPPEAFVVGDYNGEIFTYRNNGSSFDFMYTNVDTLYHYDDANNALIPVFTMKFADETNKPGHIYMELPDRFMTTVFGSGIISTSKKDQTSSYVKMVNDFYGNLPVPNLTMSFNKGWFIYNVEPGNLQEKIEQRLSESSCKEEDAAKLKELLASLDEDNNNLIFIGKLKQ